MKILVFGPYLNPPHFGGGEKYLFDVARFLAQDHQVYIGLSEENNLSSAQISQIKEEYEQFLDCDLSPLKFISSPLRTSSFFLKKIFWTRKFDAIFYLTDGSFFFSLADLNVAHIQFPLKLDKSSWFDRQKLKNWQIKLTNSEFTKRIVEPSWPVDVNLVHQPMVRIKQFSQGLKLDQKEPIILNVGRFFSHLHSKRQDILVDIFRRLGDKYPKRTKDWQLVLIGSVEDQEFAAKVKQEAKGLNVVIKHDVSRKELIDWYKKSSIYWHGTGYRVNPQKDPEKAEHFGITTVEAMAAGNVPVVIGKGGQLEVVGPDLEKWTWLTKRDCVKKTAQIIRKQELRQELQTQAQKQAEKFGPDKFTAKLEAIFS